MQYRQGLVSVAFGATAVTGSGTAWAGQVKAGDMLMVQRDGPAAFVASVQSDTDLTLERPWPGETASLAAYAIHRDFDPTTGAPLLAHGDTYVSQTLNRALALLSVQTAGSVVASEAVQAAQAAATAAGASAAQAASDREIVADAVQTVGERADQVAADHAAVASAATQVAADKVAVTTAAQTVADDATQVAADKMVVQAAAGQVAADKVAVMDAAQAVAEDAAQVTADKMVVQAAAGQVAADRVAVTGAAQTVADGATQVAADKVATQAAAAVAADALAALEPGRAIYPVASAPAPELGREGDFALLSGPAPMLYGPKTAAGWGAGVALRGQDGTGAGDVVGPAGATSGALAVYADATGTRLAGGPLPAAFATAAQGAKADTAVQPSVLAPVATTGAYADLLGRPTLGTAAAQDTAAFATAAQGVKADTAVQPSVLAPVATTGAYADLLGRPTLGTAAAQNTGAFATAAQGGKADAALPAAQKGVPNGVATLGSDGKVPASQLPAVEAQNALRAGDIVWSPLSAQAGRLLCDGAVYLRSAYPSLAAALGIRLVPPFGVPVANAAALPAGASYGADWSPDGRYLAIAHDASPYVTIYDWQSGAPEAGEPDDFADRQRPRSLLVT